MGFSFGALVERLNSRASRRTTLLSQHSKADERSSTTSAIHANYNSMEVRSDPIESAKSHLFDTSSWGDFCDVTLTLKQGHQPDSGGWVQIEDYRCRQAFRHFMNLLNRAVYGSAFRRYGKRLRVLPVLEKGEVRARSLRPWERGTSGRWHIHCAIELPSHFDAVAFENLIVLARSSGVTAEFLSATVQTRVGSTTC